MTEADLTTQRLKVLTRELNELRSSSLNLNGEPDYRALTDTPGLPVKPLIHAYLQSLPGKPALIPETRPVFYAEVPVPPRNWRTSWLVTSLLDQWGDPEWDK